MPLRTRSLTAPASSMRPQYPAPSRPSHLRQANARELLRCLREDAPCSKAELARRSGLSAPTVSSAVAYLEELGLVESIGMGDSSGGRPPGLLRFRADFGFVAAADIGGTRLRMALADLNGDIVAQWSTVLARSQKSPEAVCAQVAEGLRAMCREASVPPKRVMHLTAGAPGITNGDEGVVIAAPNLKNWTAVPLRAMLERATGLSAQVENDTNLAAVGEHWNGAARGVANFVFVAVGTGMGAGIFVRGELYHGAQWCAGEIGYFGVSGRAREAMRMRETGQLERAIGGAGLEQRWQRALDRGAGSGSPELRALRANAVLDLARDGEPVATAVVRQTAGLLADAIADLSLVLNPELVVLGGGVGSHPELCRVTLDLLKRHELACPELRSSALGTQAQLHGAISVSLRAAELRWIA